MPSPKDCAINWHKYTLSCALNRCMGYFWSPAYRPERIYQNRPSRSKRCVERGGFPILTAGRINPPAPAYCCSVPGFGDRPGSPWWYSAGSAVRTYGSVPPCSCSSPAPPPVRKHRCSAQRYPRHPSSPHTVYEENRVPGTTRSLCGAGSKPLSCPVRTPPCPGRPLALQ